MSNGIVYDVATVENAMRCLIYMKVLEKMPNFGKLTYKSSSDFSNNIYNIEEYKDRIDSTFYTDMASYTLMYTMNFLEDEFIEQFSLLAEEYYQLKGVDIINDSEGEFADFNGDSSILELDLHNIISPMHSFYAYYNEFELVSGEEKVKFITNEVGYEEGKYGLYTDFGMILKKKENINGSEINFYYVSDTSRGTSRQLDEHQSKVKYLSDRIPGNIFNAILDKGADSIDIVTFAKDCFSNGSDDEPKKANWAGRAFKGDNYGNIFLGQSYFDDVVIHEIGHLFDDVNAITLDLGSSYVFSASLDYNAYNFSYWDIYAEKYAEDIATIRKSADISCGYEASGMRAKHNEFYAEAFQLYFYSEETRAALPEKVRNRIETEIEKYAS